MGETFQLVLQYVATVEAGTATAAWSYLPTARSPAGCQDSATGSQERIEVKSLKSSSIPPVTRWHRILDNYLKRHTLCQHFKVALTHYPSLLGCENPEARNRKGTEIGLVTTRSRTARAAENGIHVALHQILSRSIKVQIPFTGNLPMQLMKSRMLSFTLTSQGKDALSLSVHWNSKRFKVWNVTSNCAADVETFSGCD